jgi:hypothetical protein
MGLIADRVLVAAGTAAVSKTLSPTSWAASTTAEVVEVAEAVVGTRHQNQSRIRDRRG